MKLTREDIAIKEQFKEVLKKIKKGDIPEKPPPQEKNTHRFGNIRKRVIIIEAFFEAIQELSDEEDNEEKNFKPIEA